ncbi:MAG TPA: hypothetical protein PLF22_12535 [Pseudomonadales bacterium]|nr:hypothetical protein [Pseudomonadales bacterium]
MKNLIKKTVASLLVLSSLFLVQSAFAIGLGEIVVESAVNQPFRARIPLLKPGSLNEMQIIGQMASEEAFAKHNLTRDRIYSTIKFRVDLNHKQGPSLVLTSEQPIKEPALNFLVELSWPSGSIMRSYSALLAKP